MRKAVKEWAAVIEALGQGKQTLLIRTSPPPVNEFMLYPTLGRGQTLKPEYDALRQAADRLIKPDQVHIEYFCRVTDTLRISLEKCLRLDKYFVWSSEHVEKYLTQGRGGTACVWLVRAFKLPSVLVIPRTVGGNLSWYNHKEDVSTAGAVPVLNESDFGQTTKVISKLCQGGQLHSDVTVIKLSDGNL
jgi:restriction system protein